jgi:hypothetical protein
MTWCAIVVAAAVAVAVAAADSVAADLVVGAAAVDFNKLARTQRLLVSNGGFNRILHSCSGQYITCAIDVRMKNLVYYFLSLVGVKVRV